jgi:hypothetical protein
MRRVGEEGQQRGPGLVKGRPAGRDLMRLTRVEADLQPSGGAHHGVPGVIECAIHRGVTRGVENAAGCPIRIEALFPQDDAAAGQEIGQDPAVGLDRGVQLGEGAGRGRGYLDLSARFDGDGAAAGQRHGMRVAERRRSVYAQRLGQVAGPQMHGRVGGAMCGPLQFGTEPPGRSGLEADAGYVLDRFGGPSKDPVSRTQCSPYNHSESSVDLSASDPVRTLPAPPDIRLPPSVPRR